MPQISNPSNDRRSLTHTGNEVGNDNVELLQNDPNNNSPVIKWTCPRKFSSIRYAGGSHKTKFVPRTKETATVSAGPQTEFDLSAAIQPVNGEEDVADMPYPPVVAKNVTQGMRIHPTGYNYAQGKVTFDSGDVADGDELALFPILTEGVCHYQGIDQFGHVIAPLDKWQEPMHIWHDFDQNRNETEIHLIGAAEWDESETLAMYVESPHEVVWEDADYPDGKYVSRIEQRVDVTV